MLRTEWIITEIDDNCNAGAEYFSEILQWWQAEACTAREYIAGRGDVDLQRASRRAGTRSVPTIHNVGVSVGCLEGAGQSLQVGDGLAS